jgi:hypothetical protein
MGWLFTVVTERMLISNIDLWLIANSAPNQKNQAQKYPYYKSSHFDCFTAFP